MHNCRTCRHSVPVFQSFCPHCGARHIAAITADTSRKGILSRLKNVVHGVHYEVFHGGERSDVEKEFDNYTPSWSFDAAIPKLESIVIQEQDNPRIRAKMAIFYACAGSERVGCWEPSITKPLGKLESSYETARTKKAAEILSWVSEVQQLGEEEFSPYDEAWAGLDEALDGSLSLYDKGINMDHAYPGGYSARAHAFQSVADGILWAHGILPHCFSRDYEPKGQPVKYGSAELGICVEPEIPDLRFGAGVVWLYEQAIKDYKQALSLDPTDTRSCVGLSHVLRQLGKKNEATDYLDRTLAILSKAIMADGHDVQSHSERAQVLAELGKTELAILDLERLLTLSTSEFDLDMARRKIEELQKGKVSRGD